MTSTILKNWHFMRILRAVMAVIITAEAFRSGEWFLLMPGLLFGMQALFDVGCCGASGCGVPQQTQYKNTSDIQVQAEEVKYEEVRKS